MGFAMSSTAFPVAKGTSGVTFLVESETWLGEEEQCIGCGACVKTCAMHLAPVMMLRELKAGNVDKAKRFGLMDCIECGCCAYVCPAHVKIVQRVRLNPWESSVRCTIMMWLIMVMSSLMKQVNLLSSRRSQEFILQV